MDEALAILDYLPRSYQNKTEEQYVGFLWESFATNYEGGKYEFANLAFHLLNMSHICFAVWRIRTARQADFEKAMVGFQSGHREQALQGGYVELQRILTLDLH